jgi:hypothetical protein
MPLSPWLSEWQRDSALPGFHTGGEIRHFGCHDRVVKRDGVIRDMDFGPEMVAISGKFTKS